jgi:TRAP-type C4-dicarboxylate transport system permease small subunit
VNPGPDAGVPGRTVVPQHPVLANLTTALNWINKLLLWLSMIALVLTALVLTYSVISRYFFKVATDWQDEASVFMLVGVTFFCTAYVQSYRGHIGIEALASWFPPKINHLRLIMIDLFSMLFCVFFSWKSWTLFLEALREGQTTTSTFAPPLWIPYSFMAAGITLLSLQLLLQLATRIADGGARHV